MSSDLRSLLGAAIQPGSTNVSRRPGARRLLEDCWTPIRNAIEPRFADILLEALGPLAKSDDEEEAKPAKIVLARDKTFLQAFSESLQAEFNHFVSDFCSNRSDERNEGKKSLSLVEYGDMEFSTLMERASARLRNAVDDEYTSVKLRLANLVRETDIRDTENPFRPVIFFRAIYLGLERIGIARADLLRMTKRFDTALIAPVAAAYAAVDRYLASQGISADMVRQQQPGRGGETIMGGGRNTVASPFGSTVVPGMLTGSPITSGGMRFVTGFSAEQMLNALYQRMQLVGAPVPMGMPAAGTAPAGRYAPAPTLGGGGMPGVAVPGHGAVGVPMGGVPVGGVPVGGMPVGGVAVGGVSGSVVGGMAAGPGIVIDPALLAALNDAQRLGAIAVAAVQQGQPPPDLAVDQVQLRAKVADKATKQIDKLTIEIVGLLFDRINQDKHVPPQIKQLLQRLQFPLIKVALVDPELFVSPHQPARELLDRIAATSAGWTPEGDQNQRYLAEIQKAVHMVLAATEEGLAPFQRALESFEKYLLDENTRDDDPVARAKRALAEAEELEVLAINATIKIRSAFDGVLLESYLREFLLEIWSRVLVAATLREKSDSGLMRKYLSIVPDLVWSVQPKINPEDRKRLVSTIPPVLTALREGLVLIEWPKARMQEFFAKLMNSHAQAVKALELAHGTPTPPAFEASTLRIKLDGLRITPDDVPPPDGGEMTIPDEMVKHAIAAAHVDVNYLTAGQSVVAGEDTDLDKRIASFKRGDWFDLRMNDATERVQLRWFTPRRALYLFSSAQGLKTHSLTPATLRQFLRDGRIAPVEGVPLFDRALREMMDELQRMSVETPSGGR
ncbi:MAG TPA: DUF1631 family protein [Burkholderiaceae bacterium]|nr:DUF1631 family protein [Burkholderiaceae bacterium]